MLLAGAPAPWTHPPAAGPAPAARPSHHPPCCLGCCCSRGGGLPPHCAFACQASYSRVQGTIHGVAPCLQLHCLCIAPTPLYTCACFAPTPLRLLYPYTPMPALALHFKTPEALPTNMLVPRLTTLACLEWCVNVECSIKPCCCDSFDVEQWAAPWSCFPLRKISVCTPQTNPNRSSCKGMHQHHLLPVSLLTLLRCRR